MVGCTRSKDECIVARGHARCLVEAREAEQELASHPGVMARRGISQAEQHVRAVQAARRMISRSHPVIATEVLDRHREVVLRWAIRRQR